MIGRILMVAARDLKAILTNKGFLLGLILTPTLILVFVTVIPRVFSAAAGPPVTGEIAVIDRSGRTLAPLRDAFDPKAFTARRKRALAQSLGGTAPLATVPPRLTVHELPGGTDLDEGKRWLLEGPAPQTAARHLALAVIPENAVTVQASADYGTYALFAAQSLTQDTELAIHDALREALIATRMKIQGLDRLAVQRSQEVVVPRAVVVGPEGERPTQPILRRFLPLIFGVLLLMSTMTGGQGLMMSLIEEKSNRVVEVLLAAVSPLELMAGKLLAQLTTGLLMLTVYVGLGFLGLGPAVAAGLIQPSLLADLLLMFLLAYLTFGAMMMTIGAAVSSVADAQSLLGPVVLFAVIPYLLTAYVSVVPNAANSHWVVTLSFLPPVNSFIMLARLASDAPPPFWQVPVTVVLGLLFAAAVLWFAAKVFKIGLLMHGKPPSFATLVRWARMA